MTPTTAAIDLDLIQTGDALIIRHEKNSLSVTAVRSDDRIAAAVLNTVVVIATKTRAGKWKLADRMHVDGHQPAMF